MPGIILPGFPGYQGRKKAKVTYPNNNPLNPYPKKGPLQNPLTTLTGGGIKVTKNGQTTNMGFNPSDPESVRRVQKFLQGKGYKIDVSGKWDKMSQGAFDNFTIKPGEQKGSRNPEWYNAHIGRPSVTPDRPFPKTKYPPTQYPAQTPPGQAPASDPPGSGYTFDPNAFNPNVGTPIDSLGQGPNLYNVKQGAASLAGLEFDPQIHQNMVDQSHVQPDLSQHLADIGNWYGQVTKALGTAKERNAAMYKGTTAEAGNAARDVLSSLGGNANLAAGVVGQAGADNANEIAQMGSAEAAYQNDLNPIFNSEAAGAKTREQAMSSQHANQLANDLIGLRGQRGQSESVHRLDLQDRNNSILSTRQSQLMDRLKYNNDLAQNQFGNSLSVAQTAAAMAMQNAQINNINASTAVTKKQGGKGSFTNWVNLDAGTRDNLIKAAMANSLDPQTLGLAKGVNPLQAWQRARQYLLGQGYTSAHATGSGPLGGRIPDMRAHNQIENMLGAAIAAARTRASNSGSTTI